MTDYNQTLTVLLNSTDRTGQRLLFDNFSTKVIVKLMMQRTAET